MQVESYITTIYPFGFFEDDGTRSLREQIYQSPFVWYSKLPGVEIDDTEGIQRWHIDPLLKKFEEANFHTSVQSGEFALMRLPVGIYLHKIVSDLQDLERTLVERTGWKFANISHAPLFAEIHYGHTTFGDAVKPCRHLWCLGSPFTIRTEGGSSSVSVKVGAFHRLTVPAVAFPFLSWGMTWTKEGKSLHGWNVDLRTTQWSHDLSQKRAGGIPLLLVR